MIEFHEVQLDDKEWIKKILGSQERLSCEFSFGNIFSYCAKLNIDVAEINDYLITRCKIGENLSYCCPVGKGEIKSALELIINDAKSQQKTDSFIIYGINEANAQKMNEEMPNVFDLTLQRDTYDYVYLSSDLIELRGKKFQPKRNHISYLLKNYNWNYEKITNDNIDDCKKMSEIWLDKYSGESKEDVEKELKIINRVFDNYDDLDYVGGLIRINGKVVAYTMGEELTKDMFCVHFEKAYAEIRGAYPLINQQFVENELSEYKYINREDDVGAENLRKAKNSYNPIFMLEKYEAKLKL